MLGIYASTILKIFLFIILYTKQVPVADLGGGRRGRAPPLGTQILSISCSFRENLAKSYVGAPPGELAPPLGKSWIRRWVP